MNGFIIFFGVIGIIVALFALLIISIYAGSLILVAVNSFKETVTTLSEVQKEHIQACGEKRREKLAQKRKLANKKKQLKQEQKDDKIKRKHELAARKAALKNRRASYTVPTNTSQLVNYHKPMVETAEVNSGTLQKVTIDGKEYTLEELTALYGDLSKKVADSDKLEAQLEKAKLEAEKAKKAAKQAEEDMKVAKEESEQAKKDYSSLKELLQPQVVKVDTIPGIYGPELGGVHSAYETSLKISASDDDKIFSKVSDEDMDAVDEVLEEADSNA